jgi:hypothetical protein
VLILGLTITFLKAAFESLAEAGCLPCLFEVLLVALVIAGALAIWAFYFNEK